MTLFNIFLEGKAQYTSLLSNIYIIINNILVLDKSVSTIDRILIYLNTAYNINILNAYYFGINYPFCTLKYWNIR